MPQTKKKNSPKSVNPINSFLAYPKKIQCEATGSTDPKRPQVCFVTKEELPSLKEIPPFFKAEPNEVLAVKEGFIVGLGEIKKLDADKFADTALAALQTAATKLSSYDILLSQENIEKVGFPTVLRLLAVAQANAEYPTDLLKSAKNQKRVLVKNTRIVVPDSFLPIAKGVLASALVEARHICAMRQTQALPGNYLTPDTMKERATDIAKMFKLSIKSFGFNDLVKMGAGGILAVTIGSAREPQLIVLEYKHPKAKKTLSLVGKGVTFDTGGISLKPGGDMHEMKFDMSGSAMALHAIASIAEQKLPVNVVCAIAMVENMPSGTAFKPGDVYTALNGQTVEVQNTDAEGRLILGDTLTYVQKHYKSDILIDMATLTGACVVALGDFYAGLFSNNVGARSIVEKAAAVSHEPVWPLPVGPRYRKMLKSDIADINNVGGRWGGASTAAAFLESFIEEGQAWAHLDIAGVGMVKKPFNVYTPAGSGYGVRLLTEIARQLA
ncbi:MAG TPA: leucyl aminopeptidase [Turneriella sp.]|nr:leucyl aminopeptidase [Turneriella sp.]